MSAWDLAPVVATVFVSFVSLFLAGAQRGRRLRQQIAHWTEAAQKVGLSGIETAGASLTASSASLQVRLSDHQDDESSSTRVEIWSQQLAPGLSLGPESGLFGRRSKKEIEVGDEEFDRAVSVQGPPALALALLDADMRRTVVRLLAGRLEVKGHKPLWASGRLLESVLRVDVPDHVRGLRKRSHEDEPEPAGSVFLDGAYKLPEVLRAALDLAARLVAPEDLAERMAFRLKSEPEPGVRLRTLLTLLREFPEAAATRQALVAAREDEHAEVRVRAGIALGKEGRDVLLGAAGGEGAEDATSARAVAELGTTLTVDQAAELLRNALRTRRMLTARACLSVLGRHGASTVPILARVLLVEKGELGEAAAAALAATEDPSAEAPLLRALAEGSPTLRRAATRALGRVGTRDAVIPLREAQAREAALRGVARQAIAEIHARLAGAAQGQLSLAGAESGQLSLAEDEAGRLSLSETPQSRT